MLPTPLFGLTLSAAVALGVSASAQTIELYDGSSTKGMFEYLDFGPSSVVKDTGSSFTINAAEDSDGAMGIFGILGRNVEGSPVDVDPAVHQLRVEYRFLDDNKADMFKLVLTDQDDAGTGEQFKFNVTADADATETSDGFSELIMNIGADDADTRTGGKDAGFSGDGDGEANYGLTQWQIQSVYGSSTPLHVEIRRIQLVEIEPGS
ncbi:MAG: hypothetical protein AAF086_03680 [Planctomycetota bacterium]